MIFVSGKSGKILKVFPTPDHAETYFSPVVYLSQNGTQLVVFGTGGETHSGGLFVIQLKKLIQGLVNQAIKIASKKGKGIFFIFFLQMLLIT